MVRHLRRGLIFGFVGLLSAVVTACASSGPVTRTPDKLYFAIKVEQDGWPVGILWLLGFEGRRLFAEKWTPGAPLPDYRLLLQPKEEGAGSSVGKGGGASTPGGRGGGTGR